MVQTRAQAAADPSRLAARRHEILEAAAGSFRKRGYHATGMRDIAAALGMTVGNLYYYFRNKQDLLAFCQEDALRRLLEIAADVDHNEDGAARKLWWLIAGHVRCLNEVVPGSLAHLEVEELEPAARRRIVKLRDRYERTLRRFVEQGVADGTFENCDSAVAVAAILGAVNWTVKWYRPDGRYAIGSIATAFATQLVRGLLRPGMALPPDVDTAGEFA